MRNGENIHTVLFFNDDHALLIRDIKRNKDGEVVSGHVINGCWDFKIRNKKLYVNHPGEKEPVCDAIFKEITFENDEYDSYDYNKLIYIARNILKGENND